MRNLLLLGLACSVMATVACSGKIEPQADSSRGGEADSGTLDTGTPKTSSPPSDSSPPDSGPIQPPDTSTNDDGAFSGVVTAQWAGSSGGSPEYTANAEFFVGGFGLSGPVWDAGPGGGCTCGPELIADPGPLAAAGTLTFALANGSAVGTLLPSPIDATGSYDLGANYSFNQSGTWPLGAELQLSATGYPGQVSPFSVSFPTPAAFVNLAPNLSAPSGLAIPVSGDFVISWTAENKANEQVQLLLYGNEVTCECQAADAAGSFTLTAAQLTQSFASGLDAGAGGATGNLMIVRTITTSTSVGNTALQLVGTVSEQQVVTFE